MYSYEKRKAAVELLIQFGIRYSKVMQKLGYPNNRKTLRAWYKEYLAKGDTKLLHATRKPKYSLEQKAAALKYYYEHGECIISTVRELGYPSRELLGLWLDEDNPNRKKYCYGSNPVVEYTYNFKKEAVLALVGRHEAAKTVAQRFGVSRVSLYHWKNGLLGKGYSIDMPKKTSVSDLSKENQELLAENERLKQENMRLQLEYDLLIAASEVIKKGQGISLKELSNKEKADVIDALRNKYRLTTLLKALEMPKSSYCYQRAVKQRPDKYESERKQIIEIFQESNKTYGYRRIHSGLLRIGITLSEKVVRWIMKEEHLIVPVVRVKKYSSYMGEISPAVKNLVKRDFHANAPNKLWLTDITEFAIPAGKIYLSPMIDCFDGLPVSWTIGTSPNAHMVNSMLTSAIATLKDGERPIVHSDRGAHYRWPGWIEIMETNHLTRSMSRKGCSPDNAACEGFHGRVKNEFFYNRDWSNTSIDEFIEKLHNYLIWYSEKRIKISLNGMSPMEYRRSLGLVS